MASFNSQSFSASGEAEVGYDDIYGGGGTFSTKPAECCLDWARIEPLSLTIFFCYKITLLLDR
mgnify:CR=1 FL=1